MIFRRNFFYHNSCCIKFAIKKKVINKDEQMKNLENDIFEQFLLNLKQRVIHQKVAFLLSALLDDVKRLSIENELEDALLAYIRTLKSKIAQLFRSHISHFIRRSYAASN